MLESFKGLLLVLVTIVYSFNSIGQIVEAKFDEDNHQYIKIKINDVIEANVVYDTGADGLYLDSLFVSQNKIDGYLSLADIGGVGESLRTINVLRGEFSYGVNSELMTSTSFIPILNLKSLIGQKIEGIVGNDLFDKKIVKVDYASDNNIVISEKFIFNIEGYDAFKLKKEDNRFYCPMRIYLNNGVMINGDFLIDLGFGGSVALTNETYKKKLKGRIDDLKRVSSKYMEFGGISNDMYIRADSMSFSENILIKNRYISYSLNNHGALSKRKYLGLIGGGIFKDFDVVFDFVENTMYLKKKLCTLTEETLLSKFGFDFIDRCDINQGYVINGIFGDKSNLEIGDSILCIDGYDVNDLNLNELINNYSKSSIYNLLIKRKDTLIELDIVAQNLSL